MGGFRSGDTPKGGRKLPLDGLEFDRTTFEKLSKCFVGRGKHRGSLAKQAGL